LQKSSKWKQSCKCSNIILEGPLVEKIKSWFEWIERKVEIIIQFIIFNEKRENSIQIWSETLWRPKCFQKKVGLKKSANDYHTRDHLSTTCCEATKSPHVACMDNL